MEVLVIDSNSKIPPATNDVLQDQNSNKQNHVLNMTNHLHLDLRFSPSKIALIHQINVEGEISCKSEQFSLDFGTNRYGKTFLTYFRKAKTSKFMQVVGQNTIQSLLDNRLHSSSDIQG